MDTKPTPMQMIFTIRPLMLKLRESDSRLAAPVEKGKFRLAHAWDDGRKSHVEYLTEPMGFDDFVTMLKERIGS